MGYKVHSFNISNKNKKLVKITYGATKILKEFEVSTFDNCFVNDYDSNAACLAHIINGNLYMIYSYSSGKIYVITTPKDRKHLWTDAVYKSMGSTYRGCGIYDNKPYHIYSNTDAYYRQEGTINCIQCSGLDNPSAAYFMFLGTDGNLYRGASYSKPSLFSTGYKYKFICGTYSSARWFSMLYGLTTNNEVISINHQEFIKLYSDIKYLSCTESISGNEGTNRWSGIDIDDHWIINGTKQGLKVKEITSGYVDSGHNYAIGLDDSKLYYKTGVVSDTYPTLIDSDCWISLAQGLNNGYGVGIKSNGKVYKLVGSNITELPQFGNHNFKISGTSYFQIFAKG